MSVAKANNTIEMAMNFSPAAPNTVAKAAAQAVLKKCKDALKKRGLTSPDRADAVALALYEGGIFDVRSLI